MKSADQFQKKTLSEEEFDALIPNIIDNFAGKSIKVAKSMWVDGLTAIEAGRLHGLSKQNAHALGVRLERARAHAPEGWVLINLYAPPALAKEVKARVKALRDDLTKTDDG